MLTPQAFRTPSVVCCGYAVVWELVEEEVWLGSCWRCRREFVASDPPAGGPRSFRRGAM